MSRKILFGFLFFLLAMIFTPMTHAQTRVLVGPAGGAVFDNDYGGFSAGIEIPFAKRFELDLSDTFAPLEYHVALGHGISNNIAANGRVWFHPTGHWGLEAGAKDSMYSVTKVSKDGDYAFGGLAYRNVIGGLPARISFDYVQQFNNGIDPNGVETNHVKALEVNTSVRFGCLGAVCVRLNYEFSAGYLLTQGNPQCDGTFGTTGGPNGGPCYRTGAYGGGTAASILFEFPRHRGHENDTF